MHLLFFLILSQFVQSQGLGEGIISPELSTLRQEGQLVSVQISLGEPLRIFVVGREEVKVDLSELKLTVKRLNPYPGKVLKITKSGDYFAVSESMTFDGPTDLEVKTKVKNKEETFHFKINNKLN